MSWSPFNSVINNKVIMSEIKSKENRINKPILSEEQINDIENTIIESFTSNLNVMVSYYNNYKIDTYIGLINKINSTNKTITINNKILYFNNILKISIKKT